MPVISSCRLMQDRAIVPDDEHALFPAVPIDKMILGLPAKKVMQCRVRQRVVALKVDDIAVAPEETQDSGFGMGVHERVAMNCFGRDGRADYHASVAVILAVKSVGSICAPRRMYRDDVPIL